MRSEKELLIESRKYAVEIRWLSWFHVLSTLAVLLVLGALTAIDFFWPARLLVSIVFGLVVVRCFVIYHDYHHGAILKKSWPAQMLATAFGIIAVTPSSIWKRSHDHHHKNNSKLLGISIGSFPLMTINNFQTASSKEKMLYLVARNPITIAAGYLTVFIFGMCVRPFMLDPKRHFDCFVSLVLHAILIVVLAIWAPKILLFTLLIPYAIAGAIGSYLFYAQHNFPSARILNRGEWSHVGAALQSSSYLKMGHLMNWFTGNIGYHHVHHLNHKIPFYRLPEAMHGIAELQSPGETTLLPQDIWGCLRLKLWDEERGRLVSFKQVVGS